MPEHITDSDGVKRRVTWGKGVAPYPSAKETNAFHRGGIRKDKEERQKNKRYGNGHDMSQLGEGKTYPNNGE